MLAVIASVRCRWKRFVSIYLQETGKGFLKIKTQNGNM